MYSKVINKTLFRIKMRIQEYLDNSESYKGIYVSDINRIYIELKNRNDRVCIKIFFEELFRRYNARDNEIENYRKILCGLSKWRISNTFWDISANKYYYDKNEKLEIWTNKLASYENRLIVGFYNKRGRKAEFLMEESRNVPLDEEGYAKKINLLLEFYIGKIKIKMSKPTSMFKLIYRYWINADYDAWWDYYETIQIEGVNRKNLNKYLQQAIFWCNRYNNINNESILKFGAETTLKHYSNYYEYDESGVIIQFPDSKYDEKPLAFYNQAFAGTNETAFLYYYKVLEFFFYISKNSRIEYGSEETCLKRLLLELDFEYKVKEIIEEYFGEYLLEKDDINNIDFYNITIEKFAEKLYKYRNSVVHGKYDETNLLTHVPMNLIEDYEDIKLKGWNSIAQELAFLCIIYFCFDNTEITML